MRGLPGGRGAHPVRAARRRSNTFAAAQPEPRHTKPASDVASPRSPAGRAPSATAGSPASGEQAVELRASADARRSPVPGRHSRRSFAYPWRAARPKTRAARRRDAGRESARSQDERTSTSGTRRSCCRSSAVKGPVGELERREERIVRAEAAMARDMREGGTAQRRHDWLDPGLAACKHLRARRRRNLVRLVDRMPEAWSRDHGRVAAAGAPSASDVDPGREGWGHDDRPTAQARERRPGNGMEIAGRDEDECPPSDGGCERFDQAVLKRPCCNRDALEPLRRATSLRKRAQAKLKPLDPAYAAGPSR